MQPELSEGTTTAEGATDQVLSTDAGEVFYFSNTGTAYSTGLNALNTTPKAPAATSRRKDTAEDGALGSVLANWGPDNQRPQQIIADIESNPDLAQVLYAKASNLISGGLVYGHRQIDEQGVERLVPVLDAEVEAWMKRTNVKKYIQESSGDFYKLWHGFTEFGLTPDRKRIASVSFHETSHCRFALQNEKARIEWVYFCANWDLVSSVDDDSVGKLPMLDVYFDVQTQLQLGKAFNYIYPTAGTAAGRVYYQPAPWHSLRASGWLELANAIPKFKKALLKNQFTIKYHVQIADWWWKAKFPDWEDKPLLKRARTEAELKAFNDKMAGESNAGNSILTMFKTGPNGEPYDGWKITAIDDKLQDGKYIEDSQEASSHIFFAVGMDPTLIGAAPGKGIGGGSGSDKRVAYNIEQLKSKAEADIILEPLQVAFDFNQFGVSTSPIKQAYTVMFRSYFIETLNQGRATKELKPGQNGDQKAQ